MASDISDREETTLCSTRYLPRTCSMTWKIRDFSKRAMKTGEKVVSEKFHHSKENDRKFFLACYPKGYTDEQRGNVSLYLHLDSSARASVEAELSTINNSGQMKNVQKFCHCYTGRSGRGYPTYLPECQFSDVLSDDVLTLRCVATTYATVTSSRRIYKHKNFDCARYESLSDDFKLLVADQTFSDAVVKLRETEFKCCRDVLSHRSPFLDSLFKLAPDSGIVEISGMEKSTFDVLLRYLYTARLPALSVDLAKMLLKASEIFQVTSSKRSCFEHLQNTISVDNVCDILILAYEYGGSELKKTCIDFVRKNSALRRQKDWKKKLSFHPEATVDLIESVTKENPQMESNSCETQSGNRTFSLKWNIRGFSKCALDPEEVLSSVEFYHSEMESLKFCVFLHPNGRKEDDGDYISLHVVPRFEMGEEITANFTLGIIDDRHKLKNISTLSLSDSQYCDRFIDTDEVDDCLTLYCEAYVAFKDSSDKTISNNQPSSGHVSLSRDLGKLYESKYLANVTLKLGEIQFEAHKNVLSARSSVFRAMFASGMRESESNLVEISNVGAKDFEVLLRYFYTAELPALTFELAKNLLIVSDKYDVPCLKSECADFLKSALSVANVSEILLLADMHSESELRKAAVDLIRHDWASVTDWKEKLVSRPELLADLLEQSTEHSNGAVQVETLTS